jgi:putative membrane protein
LSPVVRGGRALVPLIVLLASTGLGSSQRHDLLLHVLGEVAVAVLAVLLGVVSWLVTRWQISEGALRIETGLLRRSSHYYPLVQIQAIDIVESGVARIFGLAELRLRMAGSGRGKSRLAYLPAAETRVLRARLLALAHGVDEAAGEPPERLLLRLPTPMLIASIVLSGSGLITLAIAFTLLALAILTPSTALAVVSAGAACIVALLTAQWRRFNGYYNLQLAEADDGFRLRSGLIQTSAETIPVQRVQAVRLIEPLLWRPMGWCRLEVAVAGKKRDQENEAEGRRLRAVLPVGERVQAAALLQRLVPGAPTGRNRPPARARFKSPLGFHNLGWDGDDRYVVTVGGRLRRHTEWVPLAKVQSIRCVQGPVQRKMNLATIHLDAAGRSVHAELKDRGVDEVERVLAALPGLCRAARERL